MLSCAFDRKKGLELSFREPFFGFSYDGKLTNFIDQEVFFYGYYAAPELGYIQTVLRFFVGRMGRQPVFYDVGANVGHHTLFAASCGASVIAFEPATRARSSLTQKVTSNKLSNVQVVPVALGEIDRQEKLFVPQDTNIGSASLVQNHEGIKGTVAELVDVKRGDDLVARLNIPPPDCVKIDVEGYEKNVLAGLESVLREHRPFIIMELSETSRLAFGDEDHLRLSIPDCYKLYTLRALRNKLFYELRRFQFDRTHDVVAIPAERSGPFFESAAESWLRKSTN